MMDAMDFAAITDRLESAVVGYVLRIIDKGEPLLSPYNVPHMTDAQMADLRSLRDELQGFRNPARFAPLPSVVPNSPRYDKCQCGHSRWLHGYAIHRSRPYNDPPHVRYCECRKFVSWADRIRGTPITLRRDGAV